MNRSLKKTILIAALSFGASFAALTAAGCAKPEKQLTENDYTVSESCVIEAGETFVPEITVKNGAVLESVTLKDVYGKETGLSENYGFTAERLGIYTYTVLVSKNNQQAEIKFSVTVEDRTAPVIVAQIPDKGNVEIGYYDGFIDDLALLSAEDNYDSAENLISEVKTISFGGSTFDLNGANGFFFDAVGDYEVTVGVTDRSSNSTTVVYTISVVDTAPPVIKPIKTSFVWLGSGKISLPVPEVYEADVYSLGVSVQKDGKIFPVKDGAFQADEVGEYEVTYTAKDASGNTAEPVVARLIVTEDGKVANFGFEEEIALWQTENTEKYYDEKGNMVVYGSGNGALYKQLSQGDWSDYNVIDLELENRKANLPVLGLYIEDSGGLRKICELDLSCARESSDLTGAEGNISSFSIDFTKYGLDLGQIKGIGLKIVSNNPYKLALGKISLRSGEADYAVPPPDIGEAAIGFETDLQKSDIFNGGSEYCTDERYVLTGKRSAEYAIPAGSYKGEFFSEVRASSAADTVVLYVYSAAYTRVQFVSLFGGTELQSDFYPLCAGWNRIEWYVGIENGFTLDQAGLSGLILRSGADYNAVFYVDAIQFLKKDGFDDKELLKAETAFGVAFGETFSVPSVLEGNGKQVVSLQAALFEGARTKEELLGQPDYGFTDANRVEIYERLSFEKSGVYTLAYVATDILGEEHLVVYPLIAEKNVLNFTVKMPRFVNGESYRLDRIELSSEVYGEEQLSAAETEIYYRRDGNVNWKTLYNNSFETTESGFYQFKYVVKYDDIRVEKIYREFIHGRGIAADFELVGGIHDGFGIDYNVQRAIDMGTWYEGKHVYLETKVSNEWSNDGDYSLKYITDLIGWGGFYFRTPVSLMQGENGFSFCINATQPTRGAKFALLTDNGWAYSKEIDIESGIHTYTIKTAWATEYSDERLTFSEVKGMAYFIPYDPTKVYYFDTLSFVSVETNSVV